MSLENLLKIGQLREHSPDSTEIQKLLAGAARNLEDARVAAVSTETRFDAAYKAIMQAALAALKANGFRPNTNRPGHHLTVIQSLPLTIGLEKTKVLVLDTLRRKRNTLDYTGEEVDSASLVHCIAAAENLLKEVQAWLKAERSELYGSG
jgi:hypothetical protein